MTACARYEYHHSRPGARGNIIGVCRCGADRIEHDREQQRPPSPAPLPGPRRTDPPVPDPPPPPVVRSPPVAPLPDAPPRDSFVVEPVHHHSAWLCYPHAPGCDCPEGAPPCNDFYLPDSCPDPSDGYRPPALNRSYR